jgi:hypothetical protein
MHMVDIKFDADGYAMLPPEASPAEQILCQRAAQNRRDNKPFNAIETLKEALELNGPAHVQIAWQLAKTCASVEDYRQAFATVARFYGLSFDGVG